MEQDQNDGHSEEDDDDADGTPADSNQFPSHHQHTDDRLAPSDVEDDDPEHPELELQQQQQLASRLLDSPPPTEGLDEGQQEDAQAATRLSAAADEAAAAAAAGNAQDHSAAAAHTAAPQADAMTDSPSSVPLVSFSAASSSSVGEPSSSVSRIARKRSSPSASEGDAPSATRRKLLLSLSSSPASSPLPSLPDVDSAEKSDPSLAQGVGAAAAVAGVNDDAAWHLRFLGPAALSLPQVPPPHTPAVLFPTPSPTPAELRFIASLLLLVDHN
jgi:hypothetical protein